MLRTVAFTICDICTSNMLGAIWPIKSQGQKWSVQNKAKQNTVSVSTLINWTLIFIFPGPSYSETVHT